AGQAGARTRQADRPGADGTHQGDGSLADQPSTGGPAAMSAIFRLLPVLLLAALLAGCGHPTSADLTQLQSFQTANDRTVATATIACDSADPVCVRLNLQQGAACERLTEAQSAAERAAMRACALRAFRQARALL